MAPEADKDALLSVQWDNGMVDCLPGCAHNQWGDEKGVFGKENLHK